MMNNNTFPEPWNQLHFLKFCPGEYFGSNDSTSSEASCKNGTFKLNFYNAPAWVNLASSLTAIAGCILILITYRHYPNFRTGSRKIAALLALSNLFMALGSVVGSLNYLVYRYQDYSCSDFIPYCKAFVIICQLQSFVTWTSTLASFVWTTILSVFLYLALAQGSIAFFSDRHAWWGCYSLSLAIPLFVITPVAAAGFLGYSPYGNGGGCFITTAYVMGVNETNASCSQPSNETVVYRFNNINTGLLSLVKGLEVLAYVVVIVLFSIILWKMWRGRASSSESDNGEQASAPGPQFSRSWDWRLVGIPFVFVFLRMWGTITIFLSIILTYTDVIKDDGCVSEPAYVIFFVLTLLQAIGDPGQGWGNAILFVFLSPNVRHRLFHGCCQTKSKLSVSHLTSPVTEVDERDPSGFATSYQLQTSSSASSRVNRSIDLYLSVDDQSVSPSTTTPFIQERNYGRQRHSRRQQHSPASKSGNSSIVSSLFLDD